MSKQFKFSTIIMATIAVLLSVMLASVFCSADFVSAENRNVKIELTSDSVYDTDGNLLAYTSGTALSVAKDDVVYTCATQLSAPAKQVTIAGGYIAVLTTDGVLSGYSLSGGVLSKSTAFDDKMPDLQAQLSGSKILNVFSSGNLLYIMTSYDVFKYNLAVTSVVDPFSYNASALFYFDTFAVLNDVSIVGLKDQKLYKFNRGKVTALPTPIASEYLFNSIDCHGDYLYLNTDTKVVRYDANNGTFTQLGDTPYKDGKIVYVGQGGKDNLFVSCSTDASIKQYVVEGDQISYVNSFDNTIYSHPTVADIVKVAIAGEPITAYVSPRTLISVRDFSIGDKFLILSEKDGYYYVTDGIVRQDSSNSKPYVNYGYVAKSATLTITESETTTKFGTHVSVLHPNTPIYALPYETASILTEKSITERLAVVNCLSVSGGQDLWGWYTVNYMQDGTLVTGYVKATDIAPYTSLTAPAVKKSVKIKADKFGDVVTIYSLPDAQSPKVVELVDGKSVLLLQTYDPTSTWTTVQYGDEVGYVYTANIQIDGLTNVQIFIIVAVSLVVVATATILAIVLIKKRQNKY
ncbi:MAG: hypothetical protein PUG90_00755 [Clostridia bacterium]|nr:hypothetical protein [Clostridia bacterium]MDY4083075.1 hypothetical protein [Eubacteriales bacterium]